MHSILTFLLLAITVTLLRGATAPSGKPRQAAPPDQIPAGLARSDWQDIRAAYETGRHAFHPQPGRGGVWQARSPGQQWLATFDPRGFVARPDHGGWQWGLELKSYGFGDDQTAISGTPAVTADGQRLFYQHDALVREWFVNDTRGLEHGFTVAERPSLSDKAWLGFVMSVRGGLRPVVTADATGVHFRDADGATMLNYTGLKVWDADGKTLPSRFETAGGQTVRLLVDERGARYPITIDPVAQQAYLKAGNTEAWDRFGYSVAVDGETAVVGALYEDSNATGVNGSQADNSATNSGAAYVFTRSGGVWTQQAYLKAANTGADDWFGVSVAIHGDTIVVGANGEDGNAIGVNGNPADNSASNSGAAYVFTRNAGVWTQQAYLKAGNTGADDSFGISVAVHLHTVVVGAHLEDSNATGVDGDQLDNSSNNSGAAYMFTRNYGVWAPEGYLKASNTGANDRFGLSVAVNTNTVVVGASGESSNSTGVNAPASGGSGTQADNSAGSAGAVYVFTRIFGSWNGPYWGHQAYLKASNTEAGDQFGVSVAVDGNTIVVGASGEDCNTTGVNGSQTNNVAANSGAAYVFTGSAGIWTQEAYLKASNTGAEDSFGVSVDVEGNTAVVGAHFEKSNATGVNGNQSSDSAAFSGAAYVFSRDGGVWTQQAYLKASNTGADDNFGQAVAVDRFTVIVGAPSEAGNATGVGGNQADNSAIYAGAAYAFTLPVPAPTVTAISPNSGGIAGGTSVTITGTNFTGTPTVTIGGVTATNVSVLSSTGITATTPPGNAGAAGVLVTTSGGTNEANALFTYQAPDIAVTQAGSLIDGEGGVAFGRVGDFSPPLTFTITNPGNGTLTGLAVTKGGPDAGDFTVSEPSAASIAAGPGTATFTVTFSPTTGGMKSAMLQIASNVAGTKNPFDIAITGQELLFTEDTDNDGLNDASEFQMAALGFNWQAAQTALVNTYFASANGAGLFNPSQVRDLRMPAPLIRRDSVSGDFTLTFGVEKSTGPEPAGFSPLPMTAPQTTIQNGRLEFRFTAPDDAAIYRLTGP